MKQRHAEDDAAGPARPDGDTLRPDHGAADTCVAAATGSLAALLAWLESHGRPPSGPS